jgi:uncharacterized protein YegJ (DUF2314 family)
MKNIKITIGGYVKVAFKEDDKIEHMWIMITNVDSPTHITGILDNDPFILNNYKHGDKVIVKRSEISDYLEP